KGTAQTAAIRWSRTKSGAGMPSPVVVDDLLFFFGNTATCLDKRPVGGPGGNGQAHEGGKDDAHRAVSGRGRSD
ncbi:MAG: hypothetical protein ACKONH_00615, partial [Planctomycetia bacterium]